jgi:hypothetical protein
MTTAKFYRLKENPFEPTGAAAGKYPFVPPANFSILEQKIMEAGTEKKLYTLLVNSPHGAGKSTTMEYLKTKAINGGYLSFRAPVILTKLLNLGIQNFVLDILEEASNYVKVEAFEKLKKESRPSMLRKALVNALSSIATKNKLMLWIIDEFDILADRPKEEQQAFLQFLRGVIDELATRDVPIAFIMSHTKYSSREFESHLFQTHEPFRSRLVASISLAYNFQEVRQIVESRLKIVSETPRSEGDISPFTEEALKSLYDMILSVRGTDALDNFRIFERICHFALIEGAKRGLHKIQSDLIRELFEQYGLKEFLSARQLRITSLKTAEEIASFKLKSLMERNEAILRGIIEGIPRSTILKEININKFETSYLGQVGDGNIGISSLYVDLTYQGKNISLLWFLAESRVNIIQAKDMDLVIETISELLKGYGYYHIILLSYVSDIEVPKISSDLFTRIKRISSGLANDLIGLSIGVDEDRTILAQSFETEIAPLLSHLLIKETRDITRKLSLPALEVIQTIYVLGAKYRMFTRETLRQTNKRLFMRKAALQDRYIKEAVQAGFAEEEAGQITPAIPKAHIFLLEILKENPIEYQNLIDKLGSAGEPIVDSALQFHLVYREGEKIVRQKLIEYENKVSYIFDELRKVHENDVVKKSEPGQWIEWLLDAYETYKKNGRNYHAHIVLSTIEKLGPQILAEINKLFLSSPIEIKTGTEIAKPAFTSVLVPETTTLRAPTPALEREQDIEVTEDIILQTVRTLGPVTIQEIEHYLSSKGYEADIKSTVISLILRGKLKVTLPEREIDE